VHLGPGETKRVPLTVKAADLARYDTDAKAWVLDRASYRLLVGPSSRAADLLSATFRVVD
jgi:hypothetical protein